MAESPESQTTTDEPRARSQRSLTDQGPPAGPSTSDPQRAVTDLAKMREEARLRAEMHQELGLPFDEEGDFCPDDGLFTYSVNQSAARRPRGMSDFKGVLPKRALESVDVEEERKFGWCWDEVRTDIPVRFDTCFDPPPYPASRSLNKRLFICEPIQYPNLKVDVLVNRVGDSPPPLASKLVSEAAGIGLAQALDTVSLAPGEVHETGPFNLDHPESILSVGPAARDPRSDSVDQAVFRVYRTVLGTLADRHTVHSAAVCGLYPITGESSIGVGIHAAFRVLRKALETPSLDHLERVVICPVTDEMDIILETLPHYFPHNKNEELLGFDLPRYKVSSWGEVVSEELTTVPSRPGRLKDFDSFAYHIDETDDDAFKDFAKQTDLGAIQVRKRSSSDAAKQRDTPEQRKLNYKRLLREARETHYHPSDQFLFFCGRDKYGRQTVVVIGDHLSTETGEEIKHAFLYFIDTMDQVVNEPFIVLFFSGGRSKRLKMTMASVQQMFQSLDTRYTTNLAAIYVVHGSLISKFTAWLLATFRLAGLREKLFFVDSLSELDSVLDISTLPLPPAVFDNESAISRGGRLL